MKKAIILAAMLALPTFAGQKVIVQPAPVPVPEPAAAVSPVAVEIGAFYAWNQPHVYRGIDCHKQVGTIGGDITGVYNLDENQAVTLRFGYSWGSEKWATGYEDMGVEGWNASSHKVRIHTFSLMPGYRYTQPLCDKVSWFVGANVGVANASYKLTNYGEGVYMEAPWSGKYSSHKSDWGFAYSAEAGVRYALTEQLDVFCAYQFTGNTATPKDHGYRFLHRQYAHGVRAGVGIKF